MTPERFEELKRMLRDRLADFDFCGTILDDRFCDYVHPEAVGFAFGLLDLQADEFEDQDDRIAELGQMVIAAFVRYLAEPAPEESANPAAGDIERLVQLTRDRGSEIDLDNLVHDAASALAAGVNNGGVEEQVRFLCEQWGVTEVKGILRQKQPG